MSRRLPRLGAAHELPEEIPADEHVLWQGAPAWWPTARSLHIRPVAGYFAALLLWFAIDRLSHAPATLLPGLLRFGALAGLGIGLFAAYAFLVARTTSYTLTTHRLILQVGIALPISFNFPFSHITAAAVRRYRDGSGNIVVSLLPGAKLSSVVLWPHVRGGRAGLRPMLRAVADVDGVARRLGKVLAESAPAAAGAAPAVLAAPAAAPPGFGALSAAA